MSVIVPGVAKSSSASRSGTHKTANSPGVGRLPFSGIAYMYSGLAAMPTTCSRFRSLPRRNVTMSPTSVPVSFAYWMLSRASSRPVALK